MKEDTAEVMPPVPRMRPNYSCGSLAAAEQLEALMHHLPQSGYESHSQQQRQLYAAGAALGRIYGSAYAGEVANICAHAGTTTTTSAGAGAGRGASTGANGGETVSRELGGTQTRLACGATDRALDDGE